MNHLLLSVLTSLTTSALMLAPGAALAEPVPPPFSLSDVMPEPMIQTPPVKGIRLGQLNVPFEKIPLSRLISQAGVGGIAHRGDAAESTYWVCFTVQVPTPQRIWLLAGELDGPEHFVSGIQAAVLPTGTPAIEGCPSLPVQLQPISLSSGIWLGSPVVGLFKAFGKPSGSELDSRTYSYVGKVPGSYDGKKVLFDRTSLLHLKLRDGRVQGIVVSQTTTY